MTDINKDKGLDIPGEDKTSKTKTIYEAGYPEIFFRNFLAGMSRTVGAIFVYFVFLFLIGAVFSQVVLPKIMPFLNNFINVTESLKTINKFKPPGNVFFGN